MGGAGSDGLVVGMTLMGWRSPLVIVSGGGSGGALLPWPT
jgi:hypothetical protein